jgi:hypothetical protein
MATNLVIDDEPCLLTETEKKIMDDILVLLIKNKLTSHQSQNLLERLGGIIEMAQQVAKETPRRGARRPAAR